MRDVGEERSTVAESFTFYAACATESEGAGGEGS